MNQPISTSDDLALSFLQGAPLTILAVDAQETIAFVNQQATQLFGYSEQ